MRKVLRPSRIRSLPAVLGLLAASVLCLCAGGPLAASYQGVLRLLFGASAFASYVFFFAHALTELGLPSVFVELPPRPDGEIRREPLLRESREAEAPEQNRVVPAAA